MPTRTDTVTSIGEGTENGSSEVLQSNAWEKTIMPPRTLLSRAGRPVIGVLAAWFAAALLLGTPPARTETPRVIPKRVDSAAASPSDTRSSPNDPAGYLLREGAKLVDQRGFFQVTADRLTFVPADGTGRLVGLENLSLQRIAQAVREDPTQRLWQINGTVTEYCGTNFLLVTRAILLPGAERSDRGRSGSEGPG